jgi:hypothetical protein
MVKNGHKSSFAYWGLIQAFLAADPEARKTANQAASIKTHQS